MSTVARHQRLVTVALLVASVTVAWVNPIVAAGILVAVVLLADRSVSPDGVPDAASDASSIVHRPRLAPAALPTPRAEPPVAPAALADVRRNLGMIASYVDLILADEATGKTALTTRTSAVLERILLTAHRTQDDLARLTVAEALSFTSAERPAA